MNHMTCDMCGCVLLVNENVRYEVKIEVKAAYDPMELTDKDLEKDHQKEIKLLAKAAEKFSEEELLDSVHKLIKLDLCPHCQRRYVKDPLGLKRDAHPGAEHN